MPYNFSFDMKIWQLATSLTPTTGGPAHKRAGLAIVQKGPHSLADRHARRFLVRVHQLRGNHLRVFGYHSCAFHLLRSNSIHLDARVPAAWEWLEHRGFSKIRNHSRVTEFIFRIISSRVLRSLLSSVPFAIPTLLHNSQATIRSPTVGSSAPPGWLTLLNALRPSSTLLFLLLPLPYLTLLAAPLWPQVRTQFSEGPRCWQKYVYRSIHEKSHLSF